MNRTFFLVGAGILGVLIIIGVVVYLMGNQAPINTPTASITPRPTVTLRASISPTSSTRPVSLPITGSNTPLASGTPSNLVKACGNSCVSAVDCPSTNTCQDISGQGKRCVLTTCATNPSACETTLCTLKGTATSTPTPTVRPVSAAVTASPAATAMAAQCGKTCVAHVDCGSGLICSNNKCIPESCIGGKCADPCKLPNTAIISDDADRALLGLFVLFLGFILWRTNLHTRLFFALGGRYLTAEFSDSEKEKLEFEVMMAERKAAKETEALRKKERQELGKNRDKFESAILDRDKKNK